MPGYILRHDWYMHTIPIIQPHDMVIIADPEKAYAHEYTLFVLAVFVLSEFICTVFIFLILRILKQNSHVFSKNTYKLHLQFVLLLGAQVILCSTTCII